MARTHSTLAYADSQEGFRDYGPDLGAQSFQKLSCVAEVDLDKAYSPSECGCMMEDHVFSARLDASVTQRVFTHLRPDDFGNLHEWSIQIVLLYLVGNEGETFAF